jgi:hypothetical protein
MESDHEQKILERKILGVGIAGVVYGDNHLRRGR